MFLTPALTGPKYPAKNIFKVLQNGQLWDPAVISGTLITQPWGAAVLVTHHLPTCGQEHTCAPHGSKELYSHEP